MHPLSSRMPTTQPIQHRRCIVGYLPHLHVVKSLYDHGTLLGGGSGPRERDMCMQNVGLEKDIACRAGAKACFSVKSRRYHFQRCLIIRMHSWDYFDSHE